MIFCGDIALPYAGIVKLQEVPENLLSQKWVGNLEGSLIDTRNRDYQGVLKRFAVFNDLTAVEELGAEIPFAAFNIANNHILDAAPLVETKVNLNQLNIPKLGAGTDLKDAERELLIHEAGEDYVLVAFGWKVINCIYASKKKEGVNPYTAEQVLLQVEKLLQKYSQKKLVCLFHWNYELELYPQPMDRELAHQLIDMGVNAIIGCHAHRVQPVEFYKGRPIVYGMGNFAFAQSVYSDGRLRFPDFTTDEMVVELRGDTTIFHKFEYNRDNHTITYKGVEDIQQAEFATLDKVAYLDWFKKNRFQRKALPIFKSTLPTVDNALKTCYCLQRNKLTQSLSKHKGLFNCIRTIISKLYV